MNTSEQARMAELFIAVDRLERKVDFILNYLKLDYQEETQSEPAYLTSIYELIRQGQKIEAIKMYRSYTGAGLAEAKAAVESLEAKLKF
jgi:ribosomal protein L7/L12